ncbi:MAG: GAF domain-containing protein [Chloroflexota bacterium]
MESLNHTLARRNRELEAIREIFRAINATSDVKSILAGITQTTTRALEADSTSIYLLQPESQLLVLKATTGLFPDAVDHAFLNIGQGLTGWSAQHRMPVAVSNAWKDPRFHMIPNTREKPFTALLAVPLITQDRVVGAMNVQTYAARQWSSGDIEFISIISDAVAGMLERAVIQEQSERSMTNLITVAEVSKAVTAPVYLNDTLHVVAERAAIATNARRCSLLLLDEEERTLSPRAAFDRSNETPQEPAWSLSQPPLKSEKFTFGKPHAPPHTNPAAHYAQDAVLFNNVQQNANDVLKAWATQAQLNALLCVPLTIGERTIGLMNVWDVSILTFTEQRIELCKTLANQIALAIENAHLLGNAAIVKEMHHRVKNNLQNIVMLLQLQMQMDANGKVSAKTMLNESINRIMSIAAVHDVLAQDGFRLVDVKEVLGRVVNLVSTSMVRPDLQLKIELIGQSLRLASRLATAVALSVNELISNAIEHAFVGRSEGKIEIKLYDKGGNLVIEVRDDGSGSVDANSKHRSLGLTIVDTLVREDLRGTFTLRPSAVIGSVAIIEAPISFS